jgi:MFS family permease
LITLATYGVGQLIGFWVAGYVSDMYVDIKATDLAIFWNKLWIVPAGIAFVVMIIFLLFFKKETIQTQTETN